MKLRIPLFVLGLLLALPVGAQEATINSPVARTSEAKYRIDLVYFKRGEPAVLVDVVIQDSTNGDIRTVRYAIPSAAGQPGAGSTTPCTLSTTRAGLAAAMNDVRASEPVPALARQEFRELGYLFDRGCFPQAVTLVP